MKISPRSTRNERAEAGWHGAARQGLATPSPSTWSPAAHPAPAAEPAHAEPRGRGRMAHLGLPRPLARQVGKTTILLIWTSRLGEPLCKIVLGFYNNCDKNHHERPGTTKTVKKIMTGALVL